jgi:ADP-L-glycero-D-manno-heptose 6-epimerase
LAKSIFKAANKPIDITYIDIPEDIREKYQYFTEANMQKLIDAGYTKAFTPIEDGVADYVQQYLSEHKYW